MLALQSPLWTLLLATLTGCQGDSVTAKLVTEVFPEPRVALLAAAACEGDAEGMDRALASGADVNSRGERGFTPLFWALTCRNADGMRHLLARGADPNARLDNESSVPWLAATYSDSRFLRLLAEHGADLDGTEEHQNTSALLGGMTSGFQNDYWENYYFVLDSGADINIRYGPMPGVTAPEKAVGLGRFDKALELLERGYNRDLDRLETFAARRPIDQSSPQADFKSRLLDHLGDARLGDDG